MIFCHMKQLTPSQKVNIFNTLNSFKLDNFFVLLTNEHKCYLKNDQNKPYGLLSDPTSMILYLYKSD